MKKLTRIKNLNTFALRWLTILSVMAIVSIGRAPLATAQANWAQTYYNSAHTGYNPNETTLGVGNVPSLQLLWAAGVPGGVTNFTVDGGAVYATGQSNNLVALNASTGAKVWGANTGGNGGENGGGSIATGGGLVFAQCFLKDTGGISYGAICAYKASTGKIVWQYSTPCNCLPEAGVESPLVFANGVVYFGYANGGTTHTIGIYAVNAATGKLLWGFGEFSNSFSVGPAAVAGSDVYVEAGESTTIDALTTSSGTLTWSTPISTGDAAVSASGGLVFASAAWTGTDATVYALNATTGVTEWSYTYAAQSWCGSASAPSPAAIANGIVYFQGIDGNLYALRAKSGTLVWSDAPNNSGPCERFTSSPSIANGVVYISGGDDLGAASNTTAYNAATGALLWGSPSPHGTLYTPPVVVNGILYFASPGDTICKSICAYSLPAGAQNE